MSETTKIILPHVHSQPKEILLRDWKVVSDGKIRYLMGKVYGHPSYTDGELIGTSELVKIENGYAHVDSGKVYKLEIKMASLTSSLPITENKSGEEK